MIRRLWFRLAAGLVVLLVLVLVIAFHPRSSGTAKSAGSQPSPVPTSTGPAPDPAPPTASLSISSTPTRSTPTPISRSAGPPVSPKPAPSTPAPTTATATASPTAVPNAPVGSYPSWLPFRTTMKVGCVKSNCENNYHGYWAIDFETLDNKPGAPVYAAGAGRVRIASQGSGNCGGPGTVENALIVEHGNGVESVYVHLHDFAVVPGTWVTPSTVIGHVGTSGYTDPCPDYHLHYEVRINGVSVNPGALKACHGTSVVSYPYALGYADWNAVPPQEYAGGTLDPKGRTLYSDGVGCG